MTKYTITVSDNRLFDVLCATLLFFSRKPVVKITGENGDMFGFVGVNK